MKKLREVMEVGKSWLDDRLHFIHQWFVYKDILPNQITLMSFISGFLAMVFLFWIHWLFILFALLHLFFDHLDGAIARMTNKVTKQGALYDDYTDRAVNLMLIVKAAFFLKSDIAILAVILFFINYGFHYFAKRKTDIIHTRLILIIGLITGFFDFTVVIIMILSAISVGYQTLQKTKIGG